MTATGAFLAAFIDWLNANELVQFNQVSIVGFSLGGWFSCFRSKINFNSNRITAHVAGMAGKQTTRGRVGTIVGLDPAGPLFNENNPDERLASGDADYVEGGLSRL